jgi:protein-tyrosine phosphatase
MEEGVRAVNALGEDVEVLPGGELDLDFARRLDDDALRRFGLGGNPRLLLLETPFTGWPLDLAARVFDFAVRGYRIVLAHPERNSEVQEQPDLVAPLVDAGVAVQLTAASVDGRLGKRAAKTSQALIDSGHAHVIASDAHAPATRAIGLGTAVDAVGDAKLARWLTQEVPAALLAGAPLPARPARRKRLRRR